MALISTLSAYLPAFLVDLARNGLAPDDVTIKSFNNVLDYFKRIRGQSNFYFWIFHESFCDFFGTFDCGSDCSAIASINSTTDVFSLTVFLCQIVYFSLEFV